MHNDEDVYTRLVLYRDGARLGVKVACQYFSITPQDFEIHWLVQ
jgi:hypothetical protein